MKKTITRLLTCCACWLLFCALPFQSNAQVDSGSFSGCGFSRYFMLGMGVDNPHVGATAALTPPVSFPTTARDTCGKFIVYYEDLRPGLPAAGFAEGSGVGVARRNTLCSVLGYIQSVFDFSNIPAGGYIRLHVDTSWTLATSGFMPLPRGQYESHGVCGPYYSKSSLSPGAIVNGFVFDYINSTTGHDPNPDDYHATLRMNFSNLIDYVVDFARAHDGARGYPINYYNDASGAADACSYDLYSILLHQVSHSLGWFSWHDDTTMHSPFPAAAWRSNYDQALMTMPDPVTSTNPFGSLSSVWTTTPGLTDYVMLNNKMPPYNCFTKPLNNALLRQYSHLTTGQFNLYTRITPGDEFNPVMAVPFWEGRMTRTYTKEELIHFRDAIGLPINSTFASGHTDLLGNRRPYSSRMGSDAYNAGYISQLFPDTVAADFSLTNNTGASLTISLASDASLHDADGDPISVKSGSLVNLRGCGSGGNNHNQLSVSVDGLTITYTPRANFYGRAQFGFTLWDGKEAGAFVVYTIDVSKGTNVSISTGDNMVQNGNFEEGTETKTLGVGEAINNSIYQHPLRHDPPWPDSRLGAGGYMSDGHPFDASSNFIWGTAIRNSFEECTYAAGRQSFGHPGCSFPWRSEQVADKRPWDNLTKWFSDGFPESSGTGSTNDRYQPLGAEGLLLNLLDTLKPCAYYVLEFDAYRTYGTPPRHATPSYAYPGTDQLTVDCTRPDYVSSLPGVTAVKTYTYPIASIDDAHWQHFKVAFTYCAPQTSSMLRLKIAGARAEHEYIATLLLDNISLKESSIDAVVHIQDSVTGSCSHTLAAGPKAAGCVSMSYTWRSSATGATVLGTGYTLDIAPMDTTTYYLTASDGCSSTSDSMKIIPCRCAPSRIFSTHTYTTLTGTVSSLGSGYYYVPGHVDISGTPTATGATFLMAPGSDVTVTPAAVLTLSNSHLFTCPDTNRLWQGITLASGGTSSGRIELNKSTLVEDAETAISASFPRKAGSLYIIKLDTAIFNRNITAIAIDNYKDSSGSDYPFLFRSAIFTSRDLSGASGYPLRWYGAKTLRGDFANTAATAPYNLSRFYSARPTKNSVPAFAGLRLTNVGITSRTGVYYDLMIGDVRDSSCRNIFDNTGDGIYAVNSDLKLCNNVFMNLNKVTPGLIISSLPLPTGTGIYSKGSGMDIHLQLYKTTPLINVSLFNSFYDCITGINAVDCYELNDSGSLFQTSNTNPAAAIRGLQFNAARYKAVNITDNKFYNLPNAMALYTATAAAGYAVGQVTVAGNTINAQPPSPVLASSSYTCLTGITGGAPLFSAAGSLIGTGYWVFKNNQIYDVYNGIVISNMRKQWLDLEDNDIRLVKNPSSATQYGIEFSNCLNPQAVRNHVNTLAGSGAILNEARAFYFSGNTGNIIRCNDETNFGRGFDFIGTQPTTQWYGNTMTSNFRGLAMGGTIDVQGNSTSSCYARWSTTGWSSTNQQTYAYWPSKFSPLYIGSPFSSIPGYISIPTFNTGLPITSAYNFDTASLRYSTFAIDPCTQSIASKPLTSSLTATSSSVSHIFGPVLAGFFRFGKREQWNSQMSLYRAISVDSSFNDTLAATLLQFQAGAASSRFAWLAQIEDALAIGDAGTAHALLSSPVAAAGDFMVDTLLLVDADSADAIVSNYTRFYGICLDRLNGIEPDSLELADLAFRCPLSDGGVVYQARNLYSLCFGYNDIFNEDALCHISYDDQDQNIRKTITTDALTATQAYSLFPNPNKGRLQLQQQTLDTEPVMASVYNMAGQKVYRGSLQFTGGRSTLILNNQAAGNYLLQLSDVKGRNFSLKFTIH